MYKVKLSPEEALETIKLRMKYDSSKTLTENVGIVDEQEFNEDTTTGLGYNDALLNNNSGTKWYDVFVKRNGSGKSKVRDDQFWSYASNGNIWNFKKNGKFIYAYSDGDVVNGKWVNLVQKNKVTEKDRGNNGFGSTGI